MSLKIEEANSKEDNNNFVKYERFMAHKNVCSLLREMARDLQNSKDHFKTKRNEIGKKKYRIEIDNLALTLFDKNFVKARFLERSQ